MTEDHFANPLQRDVQDFRVGGDRPWQIAGVEQKPRIIGLDDRTEAPLGSCSGVSP